MRCRLFTILSVLSLLLCVAVCVLWVRSYWRVTGIVRYSRTHDGAALQTDGIYMRSGRIVLLREWWERGGKQSVDYEPFDDRADALSDSPWRADVGTGWLGFSSASTLGWSGHSRVRCVPCWPLVLVVVTPPVLSVRRVVRKHQRDRLGLCPTCGYDLRATPDLCPECGTQANLKGNT